MIDIRQDRDVQKHTGGIVWETAFLLATFLEVSKPPDKNSTAAAATSFLFLLP